MIENALANVVVPAFLEDPAGETWQIPGIGPVGILTFLCPNPAHGHVVIVRVHHGEKVTFPGDKQNVWHYEDAGPGQVAISPSVLCWEDFHTTTRTVFRLVPEFKDLWQTKPSAP